MAFDAATLDRHGITPGEYDRIRQLLGREPNLTELGMFSVMWSEHCSYKSSRVHLKTLPTTGPRVVQGPGENAGAVDIGDGLAAVFKIESHNHPSFIEPYQGAATGVGGIIRDIFTMGARPIALLNALRFGPIDNPQTRRIVAGIVSGIGGYGNAIGIPTIGGEVFFDESYAQNPLVNALCLGIARIDDIIKGRAEGVGNPVYYVGAKTGRDGIHGATMASAEFDEASAEKRPAVQVGDPFMEKLLLEACLEVMKSDALVGIQDMGAAGLTCSTCEMAARAGTGIEFDVTLVPRRETGMTAVRDAAVRIAGAHAPGREAGPRGRGRGRVRALRPARREDRRRDGRRPGPRPRRRRRRRRDPGPGVDRRGAALQPADAPPGRSRRPARRRSRRAEAAAVAARCRAGAARLADDRQQALDLPAVRLDGPHQHAGAGRLRHAGGAREGIGQGAGHLDRRQRPLRAARSEGGRDAGGGRGGAQRRLRRRACRSASPTT